MTTMYLHEEESVSFHVTDRNGDRTASSSSLPTYEKIMGENKRVDQATDRETVTLNISGRKFEMTRDCLEGKPTTRLGKLAMSDGHYRPSTGDFFFDRNPTLFESVLEYYCTDELHIPPGLCIPNMKKELDFWEISDTEIADCCWPAFQAYQDKENSLRKFDTDFRQENWLKMAAVQPSDWKRRQYKVWAFFDDPSTSRAALVFALVSFAFVLLSIFVFCAETHPDLQYDLDDDDFAEYYGISVQRFKLAHRPKPPPPKGQGGVGIVGQSIKKPLPNTQGIIGTSISHGDPISGTTPSPVSTTLPPKGRSKRSDDAADTPIIEPSVNETNTTNQPYPKATSLHKPYDFLPILDAICNIYFTVELILRFVFSPSKLKFMMNFYTWVEIVSIFPYYVNEAITLTDPAEAYRPGFEDTLRILYVVRIFRVFRLMRHYTGMQILIYTVKASLKEFLLMTMFMMIGILVFSSLIFHAEVNDNGDMFGSIPKSFWWCIITMTTVGYGDMYPKSRLGYVIGSLTAISGVLVISFTVPIIVNNFVLYYSHAQTKRVSDKLKEKHTKILTVKVAATSLSTGGSTDGKTATSPFQACGN